MLTFISTLYVVVAILISIIYTVYYSDTINDPIEIFLVSLLWPLLLLESIYNRITH